MAWPCRLTQSAVGGWALKLETTHGELRRAGMGSSAQPGKGFAASTLVLRVHVAGTEMETGTLRHHPRAEQGLGEPWVHQSSTSGF